jgi:hypothetical protein
MDSKIASLKKPKKGTYATNASFLEDLAFKGHKFSILEFKMEKFLKLKKIYSEYFTQLILISKT